MQWNTSDISPNNDFFSRIYDLWIYMYIDIKCVIYYINTATVHAVLFLKNQWRLVLHVNIFCTYSMCYCVHVDLFRTTTQYNLTGGERPFKSSLPHSSFIQKKWSRTILLSLVHVTRKDNFTMELIMLSSPELTMQHRNLKSWSRSH